MTATKVLAEQPSGATITGCTLLECLVPNALGDIWRVRAPDGGVRLAKILNVLADNGPSLISRLQSIRHPVLLKTDIFNDSGKVLLVFEPPAQTLWDRYQECRADGLPGIPRDELLGYMDQAAAGLDELRLRSSLAHLGLNPRNLWLDEDRISLFEFGLVELLWVDRPAGPLNARYAAPESFDKGPCPQADQYSLAMIFAELLTGVHPRPSRSVTRASAGKGPGKLNLDLLPAFDRPAVARALHGNARQRFASNSDFVRALEKSTQANVPHAEEAPQALPALVPVASLCGDMGAPTSSGPTVAEFVTGWILSVTGAEQMGKLNALSYLIKPGNVVEHRCPIRMIPGGLTLKLHDFPKQWAGILLAKDDSTFHCRVPASRNLWQRCFGGESGMEVQVLLQLANPATSQMVEATIRVQPYGNTDLRLSAELNTIGPALIDSVRTYLQAEPDLRGHERWPCEAPVHVYPVLPDLQLGKRLAGICKDISLGGMRFAVGQQLTSETVYVSPPESPALSPFAVLLHVLRNKPAADSGFEVGGEFGE